MVQIRSRRAGQGSNKLTPIFTGPHEFPKQNSDKRWFELKTLDEKGKTSRANVDLIKPYYTRKITGEMDNPKKDIEFRSDLELAEEYMSEGIQAKQLPVFKADKHEDAILEGGDFTPQEYTTRSGRQTKSNGLTEKKQTSTKVANDNQG